MVFRTCKMLCMYFSYIPEVCQKIDIAQTTDYRWNEPIIPAAVWWLHVFNQGKQEILFTVHPKSIETFLWELSFDVCLKNVKAKEVKLETFWYFLWKKPWKLLFLHVFSIKCVLSRWKCTLNARTAASLHPPPSSQVCWFGPTKLPNNNGVSFLRGWKKVEPIG